MLVGVLTFTHICTSEKIKFIFINKLNLRIFVLFHNCVI